MKKTQPTKPNSTVKTGNKETKVVPKESKPATKNIGKTEVQPPPQKKEQPKEVEKPAATVLESQEIPLTDLAPILQSDDTRCIYLVDEVGNSYTFFKYKGRLIDIPTLYVDMHVKQTPRENIMETIRKKLVYGITQGEAVVFHVGNNELDLDEFFKGETFWEPNQLFRSPEAFNEEWYRSKVVKPTDTDNFGNQGTIYPSKETHLIVSTSQDIPFGNVKWLKDNKKYFRKLKII